MTSIAEKLAGVGYRAHAVGKWDCGMATDRHTPMGRGYQTWLGYFGHCVRPPGSKHLGCWVPDARVPPISKHLGCWVP
eukprot:3915842-Prymnesium_polylepis.2